MASLRYSVHVAPSKPVVSDDLPPGEARRMWSPTSAILIHGEQDAVADRIGVAVGVIAAA